MKAVCALLLCLSIVGRIAIFLVLAVGLLVLWLALAIVSLTTKLRNILRRSKRPAGLPHGSCGSLSDEYIASIVTSRDSSEHDQQK